MVKMIVCLFDAHGTAEAARRDLLERGFDPAHIRVAGGETRTSSANATADHAAAILARAAGSEDSLHAAAQQGSVSGEEIGIDVDRAASALEAMRPGPRIYSLPNSPTGWGEASRGAANSIGGNDNDPARPTGLVRDVSGLGTDTDRSRLSGKS